MFAMCCAILQFAARPFLNDTLDVLDCLSMISVSLYLSCGLTFQQKDLTDPQNPQHDTYLLLPKLAQSVAGFNCVIAVLTFYLDFRSSSKANSIKIALTDGVTAAIKTIAMRLRSDGESARSLTHTEAVLLDSVLVSSLTGNADMALATEFAEVSEKAGPDVWTNELPEILLSTSSRSAQRLGHAGQAMRSALLMGHAQEGNHAPAGLLTRLINLRADKSTTNEESHPRVCQMMDEEELIGMLEPEAFSRWVDAQLQRDPQSVISAMSLYAHVNAVVRNSVSDSSRCSVYASNKTSVFYSKLVNSYPYILDALLQCSQETAKEFNRLVSWVNWAHEQYGENGSLANLVVPLDRGALAHFLAEQATEESRTSVRDLLNQVFQQLCAEGRSHFVGRFTPLVRINTSAATMEPRCVGTQLTCCIWTTSFGSVSNWMPKTIKTLPCTPACCADRLRARVLCHRWHLLLLCLCLCLRGSFLGIRQTRAWPSPKGPRRLPRGQWCALAHRLRWSASAKWSPIEYMCGTKHTRKGCLSRVFSSFKSEHSLWS